jgi:hypothetical protein
MSANFPTKVECPATRSGRGEKRLNCLGGEHRERRTKGMDGYAHWAVKACTTTQRT